MKFLDRFVCIIDWFSDKTGYVAGWLSTLMVLVVFYDTIMRYIFNEGNLALQELEWHLFAIVFLIGAAYTLKEDGHVRVDIIFVNLSDKTKAWIDLFGIFVFLIPFSMIVIHATSGFVTSSWAVREVSPDPGGLPARYLLKAMIPLCFIFLIIQGLSEAAKRIMILTGYKRQEDK